MKKEGGEGDLLELRRGKPLKKGGRAVFALKILLCSAAHYE
jgi:hypothetical protein